jgi:hypothetical protein
LQREANESISLTFRRKKIGLLVDPVAKAKLIFIFLSRHFTADYDLCTDFHSPRVLGSLACALWRTAYPSGRPADDAVTAHPHTWQVEELLRENFRPLEVFKQFSKYPIPMEPTGHECKRRVIVQLWIGLVRILAGIWLGNEKKTMEKISLP